MKSSKLAKLKLDSFEVISKQAQKSIIGGNPYSGGGGGSGPGNPPRSLQCSTTTTPNGGTPWIIGQSGRDYYTEDYCCSVVYGGNYNACISNCGC